ncbi:thiamine-monophosphate kinase [Gloeocapsa sp. PCC 73106]|nr:thiamine-monophosphate kinase [Gloeocapsa sp. PCC 73106]
MVTVREIGEQGLLARLQRFCPPELVGDDAAILKVDPEKSLVITTDVLVDEVHFSDRTTPPQAIGWRAVAANLSDLAAMGASPIGITVGLSVGGDVEVSWIEEVYQGMSDCLRDYHAPIVGGDICSSKVRAIAITALGEVKGDRVIRRSTAQPGDIILITGDHGASRAGLECLLNPLLGNSIPEVDELIKAHQKPIPRLDVLPYLEAINLPIAGMDSSDGLADAVLQIARASGVGAEIDAQLLPILPILQRHFPEQALDWTLYGGEDFELVLCLPEKLGQALQQSLGKPAAIIGKITPGSEVKLVDSNYTRILSLKEGFQHF